MFKHIITLFWNSRRSSLLLAMQIFLAFLVLFAVLSFSISNFVAYSTPLGFNVADTYTAAIDLPEDLDSTINVDRLYRDVREEVNRIEGVEAVARLGQIVPFDNSGWGFGVDVNGIHLFTQLMMADEHFQQASQAHLSAGRWFTDADTIGGNWAVVVNQRFIDENFPGGFQLDSLFEWFGKEGGRLTKVVGVVDHFKYRGEFATEEPLTFVPDLPWNDDSGLSNLLVRTQAGASANLEEEIHQRISEVVKGKESIVMANEVRREDNSRMAWIPIIAVSLICAFLIANVALGLFGILINAIAKRRGEIGLRKAMGATGADITRQFTFEVLFVALVGISIGSLVAVQIPFFELIELEVKFFWYGGLCAAALILLIVLLCALLPSLQAAKIHPAIALRED